MDFIAKIVAQLDTTKADEDLKRLTKNQNINLGVNIIKQSELSKITKQLSSSDKFKINVSIKDTSAKNIERQIKSIVNGLNIDLSKAFNLNGLNNLFKQVGKNLGKDISKNSPKSKIASQIYNIDDLKKQGVMYFSKASNTIDKQMVEITKKARKLNWKDFAVTGFEEANGKIKNFTIQVTEATGEVKKLYFERQKLERISSKTGKSKIDNGFVLGDVNILKTATESQIKEQKKIKQQFDKRIKDILKDVETGKFSAEGKIMSDRLSGYSNLKNVDSVNKATKALKDYDDALLALTNHFNGTSILSDNDLIKTFDKLEKSTTTFKNNMREVVVDTKGVKNLTDVFDRFSKSFGKFNNKQFEDSFGDTQGYQKLKDELTQAEKLYQEINNEIKKGNNANFDKINADLHKMISLLNKADNQFDRLESSVSQLEATTASNATLTWLNNNSKAAKEYGAILKDLAEKQRMATTQGEFENATAKVKEIQSEAKSKGLIGKTWLDESKRAFVQIAEFTGMYGLIQNVTEEIPRQMIDAIRTVDDEMTKLQMATGLTDSEARKLMSTYSELGKELKTLGTDIASSSTEWLKQGKSLSEAEALTKDSIVLSKIGDMSSEDATRTITAAMKSYNLLESEVMGFIDQISAIDMASATDVGGLSDAFNEVAANAKIAGVETEKLLSYLATIGETSQEGMSSVGTAVNAIFSRMGNIKLSRLKDYENDGEDLSNVETVLKKNGIALRDTQGQFREFDEVLEETAKKWEEFDSVTQRVVSNAFAGTHHANSFIILMENWQSVEKYITTAVESSGEAMKKFEACQNSLSGSIEGFKNAFQSLSNTTIDSGFLTDVVDVGTEAIEFLDKLIDKFGMFPTLLSGIAVGKGVKSIA